MVSDMRRQIIRDKTATAAIEFAILAPIFILVVLSMIGYGIYLSASHAVQQITADAARAAVAGLNPRERADLASSFVRNAVGNYAFITASNLAVEVKDDPGNTDQFTVTIDFDARGLPIWSLYAFAMPGQTIKRYATIRIGGV